MYQVTALIECLITMVALTFLCQIQNQKGAVLVLHIPFIKYIIITIIIFETNLGIICIAVGKNRKGRLTLLDDLPVKGSMLLYVGLRVESAYEAIFQSIVYTYPFVLYFYVVWRLIIIIT